MRLPIPGPRRRAPFAAAVLAAATLALAPGCGADGERDAAKPGTATSATPSTAPGASTETAPTEPEKAPLEADPAPTEPEATPDGKAAPGQPAPTPSDEGGAGESPEGRSGGVGDEVPALSEALFTGKGGRVVPAVVRVTPFIAIRARLRSADGADYVLGTGTRTLRATGGTSGSATFDGLRPGRRIVLEGPHGRVVIVASAEPGP